MSDETPKTDDPMVAALLREREGYAGRKGKEDRVEAVDEQLRLRGYTPDGERIVEDSAPDEPQAGGDPDKTSTSKAETERRSTPPKGRQARSTETA
ncbi:hypothetical protein OIE43_18840 [Streptomyces pseudovenezuelae]|uniref:hypothetical protein n=1 Tax=Streptomyces pseudovenezuelae TaxID=67350 RepID=UPI002E3177CE|nr:hypothetical protein [Streptomyces pseudovenezuelae]